MFEECATPIPVARLVGRSGFGSAVRLTKDAVSDDIQDITFLGGCLIWNDAAIYGDRIQLNLFLSVWYDMWKYRER